MWQSQKPTLYQKIPTPAYAEKGMTTRFVHIGVNKVNSNL